MQQRSITLTYACDIDGERERFYCIYLICNDLYSIYFIFEHIDFYADVYFSLSYDMIFCVNKHDLIL